MSETRENPAPTSQNPTSHIPTPKHSASQHPASQHPTSAGMTSAGGRSEPHGVAEGDDQITLSVRGAGAGQVVIEVGGEVDMLTSPQLRSVLLEQFAPDAGVELVVLHLDGVTFLGTSGLAVLIEVREAAHRSGVELRLACTVRRVLRPLTIAGLVPLFDIHDSTELALVST